MTKLQIKTNLEYILSKIEDKDKEVLKDWDWLNTLEDGTNCKETRIASCSAKSDAYDDCKKLIKLLLSEM